MASWEESSSHPIAGWPKTNLFLEKMLILQPDCLTPHLICSDLISTVFKVSLQDSMLTSVLFMLISAGRSCGFSYWIPSTDYSPLLVWRAICSHTEAEHIRVGWEFFLHHWIVFKCTFFHLQRQQEETAHGVHPSLLVVSSSEYFDLTSTNLLPAIFTIPDDS